MSSNFPTNSPTPALFSGPEGLWTADPVELAARLYVAAFRPVADAPLPQIPVGKIYEALAALGGYTIPEPRNANTQPLALTVQLAQEAILIWERASIGVRLSAGDTSVVHTVTALRFGPAILGSQDPVTALKEGLK